jgi:hypothetical protein
MSKTKDTLTIADYELLGQAYVNLIEAGLILATIEYDDFLEAVLTGDTFDFEKFNKEEVPF